MGCCSLQDMVKRMLQMLQRDANPNMKYLANRIDFNGHYQAMLQRCGCLQRKWAETTQHTHETHTHTHSHTHTHTLSLSTLQRTAGECIAAAAEFPRPSRGHSTSGCAIDGHVRIVTLLLLLMILLLLLLLFFCLFVCFLFVLMVEFLRAACAFRC